MAEPGTKPGSLPPEASTCPVCGTKFFASADGGFCPVCILRGAIGETAASGETGPASGSAGSAEKADGGSEVRRFENYEVILDTDGRPIELGRGAMGITYKALDVNLRCPVTLKVISERYLGDESARLRFLREARAAASVRHPNVASAFHLGKTGENYFYAMEFVEGETLEHLIKRAGHVEAKLVLEIISQVAAGLAAVHKQKLVHRDVKPSNIMVNLQEGGAVTAKIIDLGLAKAVNELGVQTAISTPGAFVGTPEFASPEQFAGVPVDIRSDLYSLGVTLWQMLAGQPPFRGSLSEVMQQHQYSALPLENLKNVPQPAVALIEVLLRKDPARRFQTPAELLAVVPTVRDALEYGRTIQQTTRVFISSSTDVQKERNLAERVLRSIAAEFNLTVNSSNSTCQRLVEADSSPEDNTAEPNLENRERFVLCPYFWEFDGVALSQNSTGRIPDPGHFDLIVTIIWSRLSRPVELPLPGGSAPTSGTEYEVAWALYHASETGGIPMLHIYRNESKPAAPLEPKEAREEFGREWDAVQEFFARWDQKDGVAAGARLNRYDGLEQFEELFRVNLRDFLASQLERERDEKKPNRRVRRWKSSPFRGLNVFDFEHAPIFYGRTRAVGEALEAMEEQRRAQRPFVLILGASGSGKSSLVRAGVLPLVTQPGTIEGAKIWRRAVTRPGAGGTGGDCFDALAAALLEPVALPDLANPESTDPIHDLATELRDQAGAVALRVRDALDHVAREWRTQRTLQLRIKNQNLRSPGSDAGTEPQQERGEPELPKARMALVIDQFEELFTSGFSANIRQKYVSAIAGLVQSGRVFVFAALRSDFYSSYQDYSELVELTKRSGKVDLRPPTAYEIGNMIRLPAEAAGLSFERDPKTNQRLDEALRDVAAATPESLPLLEHVLSLLYEKQAERSDGLLRWTDYRELGEVKGALAQHAEKLFSTLKPDEQLAFPLVMRHLVTLGQGEEEVPNRRTVPYRDFVTDGSEIGDENSGAKAFVDLFIQTRLLVADRDPQGEVTVSVTHEALLREWQRIRDWLVENREFLRMRDRLDSSLKLWLSRGQQEDDLLGLGLPLAEGEKLLKDFGSSLSPAQIGYIQASIAEQRRRHRIRERVRYSVIVGITAALIVAVIFALVSYRQYRRAERAQVSAGQAAKQANAARRSAEDMLNYLLNQLSAKLEPIGHLDIVEDVQKQIETYYKNSGFGDRDPRASSNWATLLQKEGDRLLAQGDSSGAKAKYQEELEITRKLVEKAPGNTAWQRSLSVAYESLGDVLKSQGDLDGAKIQYQNELEVRQALATHDPSNSNWQRDLSVCYKRLGDILKARGDLKGARLQYERELQIMQALVKKDGNNSIWQNDLFVGYVMLGDVAMLQGDLSSAKVEYQNALDVIQKTVSLEPGNTRWQRDVAASCNRLGDALKALGDLNDAKIQYERGLEITQRLAKQDPSNSVWQLDLSVSYDVLGSLLLAQEDLSGAKSDYQMTLAILQRLADQEPGNTDWQYALTDCHQGLGDVSKAQKDLKGAYIEYQTALNIIQKLARKDPGNGEWLNALAASLEKLGDVLTEQRDFAGAKVRYQDALRILQDLAKKEPSNTDYQHGLADVYRGLGVAFQTEGDASAAEKNFRASFDIITNLIQLHGENPTWNADLDLLKSRLREYSQPPRTN